MLTFIEKQGMCWALATFLSRREFTRWDRLSIRYAVALTPQGRMVRYPGWGLGCDMGLGISAQLLGSLTRRGRVTSTAMLDLKI
jgi:hypothetical protein